MMQSQEREDEDQREEPIPYPFSEVVPPEPFERVPISIAERLVLMTLFAFAGLFLWIVFRGIYLSVRELWRFL